MNNKSLRTNDLGKKRNNFYYLSKLTSSVAQSGIKLDS